MHFTQTLPWALIATVAVASPINSGVNLINKFAKRDIGSSLGPLLSKGAVIYTPSDPQFAADAARWSEYSAPDFVAVVEPATEADVSVIVKYAQKNNMDFLAQGGGHGYSPTLKTIKNAIQIHMGAHFGTASVDNTTFAMTVGGGTTFTHFIDTAYAAKRELTTGSCPCVGAIGATLGGGHGIFQGRYGLSVDAIESLRVVLANGKLVTASPTQNKDLFYAMRGAGASFGVVTYATYKTYPQANNGEVLETDIDFDDTKLEKIFEYANSLIGPQFPKELGLSFGYRFDSTISKPSMALTISWTGPAAGAKTVVDGFARYGNVSFQQVWPWNEYPLKVNGGEYTTGGGCDKDGSGKVIYSVNTKKFPVKQMRQTYTNWATFAKANPEVAHNSGTEFEVFGQTYPAPPFGDSAYGTRPADNILNLFVVTYTNDSTIPAAETFGNAQRNLLRDNSGYDKWYVYQNYGHGDEPLEALYGYGDRLPKLSKLKSKYDPKHAFHGFHDIPT